MELRLNIQYQELLNLIQQLPDKQVIQLKQDLNNILQKKQEKPTTDCQKMLLEAPVMDDEEYETYLENRKHFNQWRTT
jgi:uncharacterized protein with NAD-binding domain and iron-sulfur cluster